ncbi:MAG: glycosyltransferase family 4 protein [Cyanobacteria bacterium P01_F01_bin.150]
MKITFVSPPPNLSGGMRVIATHAEYLKKRGHDVLIVCSPRRKRTLKEWLKAFLKGKKIPSFNLPSKGSHFNSIDVDCRVIDKVRPIVDSDLPDADVVIATWWETAEWVAKLSDSKGCKSYFIQHYEVHDYLPKERVMATWTLPMRKIVVAQWLADIAKTQYGDCDVSVVPNSIDTQQFCASPRGRQSTPTVGMMLVKGQRGHWKGCDIAIQAFMIAKRSLPNLRLVSFGFDPWDSDIMPLNENIEYECRPSQERLKSFYSKCDAWLFSSRKEGFGLPILESMACGTPVIGTPCGAAPDFLPEGGGTLVPMEDADAMAKAIVEVCSLPNDEWRRRSKLAFDKATSYTWTDASILFEEALKKSIKHLA